MKAARRLSAPLPSHISTFDVLHDYVEVRIRDILGVGELAVYDATYRLGVMSGIAPVAVYLYAGTRSGAQILGIDTQA